MRRVVADAFQIVEVFGRDLFERLAHARHRERRVAVFIALEVEPLAEILQELSALSLAALPHGAFEIGADVLHAGSIQPAMQRVIVSTMHAILAEQDNPALRGASRALSPSEMKGRAVRELIADMKALLAKEKYGVALAAVQVGEPVALFIVSGRALARGGRNAPDEPEKTRAKDAASAAPPPDQVFINPTVLKMSRGKRDKHEGCLSIRGKWGEVPRAEKVTLHYINESGRKETRGASGFLAHIFQHEMDHLEGVLYTDKASLVHDEELEKDEAHATRG